MKRILVLAIVVLALGTQSGLPRADENGFLNRFGGTWSGSATVVKDDRPWEVSCRIDGQPGHNRIAIHAKCRAALLQRSYVADLVYDPETGLYTGTYVGAKVGPARLSGRRNGDRMDLTVTWPKPVDGDTEAKLLIEMVGSNTLKVILADRGLSTAFLLSQI